MFPSARHLGIRARWQLCSTAILCLSSPGFSGVYGPRCSSQRGPLAVIASGGCCSTKWVSCWFQGDVKLEPALQRDAGVPQLSGVGCLLLSSPKQWRAGSATTAAPAKPEKGASNTKHLTGSSINMDISGQRQHWMFLLLNTAKY